MSAAFLNFLVHIFLAGSALIFYLPCPEVKVPKLPQKRHILKSSLLGVLLPQCENHSGEDWGERNKCKTHEST